MYRKIIFVFYWFLKNFKIYFLKKKNNIKIVMNGIYVVIKEVVIFYMVLSFIKY